LCKILLKSPNANKKFHTHHSDWSKTKFTFGAKIVPEHSIINTIPTLKIAGARLLVIQVSVRGSVALKTAGHTHTHMYNSRPQRGASERVKEQSVGEKKMQNARSHFKM